MDRENILSVFLIMEMKILNGEMIFYCVFGLFVGEEGDGIVGGGEGVCFE